MALGYLFVNIHPVWLSVKKSTEETEQLQMCQHERKNKCVLLQICIRFNLIRFWNTPTKQQEWEDFTSANWKLTSIRGCKYLPHPGCTNINNSTTVHVNVCTSGNTAFMLTQKSIASFF